MFFLKELEKTIQLHPSYFGPLIRSHIHRELLQKEEGSSTGKYYKAIVWRPYKGEVVCEHKAGGFISKDR
jgi:DNA-directed RNA polymerase II subunit RPB7